MALSPLPATGQVGGAPASRVIDSKPLRAQYEVMSKPGKLGIRPLFAEARDVRIDQARVPLHDIVIFELQSSCARDAAC